MPHRLCSLWRVLDQGNVTFDLDGTTLATFPALPPINDDITSTVNRPALSLRVTLICDCICCIRGWPACHTRFDCSICQLLRCIFFVSHYLTESYLIGSMKVLMGLHRKFLKTILSMKKFTVSADWKCRFKLVVSFAFFSFFLTLSSVLSCPLLHFPFYLLTLKYAKYLEGYSTDGVRHVYKKACTTHLPRKPTIHLLWAAFEEQQGEWQTFRTCNWAQTS